MCQYDTDASAQGHPHPYAGILQKNEVEKRAITLITRSVARQDSSPDIAYFVSGKF